ncbi:hypothetical protein AXF42_Ash007403 [Apostasia shenzhenica]|uniref:DUF1639 domain-containing protein n=1 Tax=Apostasia shenzhenica TaxID=1088818 RepID=A0A2I0BA37_9ASPA|nr:hypothetical protein AXF42_Ash007403 [Apostasia shenzhenica]
MVIAAEEDAGRRRESASPVEKRTAMLALRRAASQSRLHNFSFPSLSWGNQRLLRCVNVSGGSAVDELESDQRRNTSSSPDPAPPPRIRGQKRGSEDEVEESTPAGEAASRPWNLRTRRAACNAPGEIGPNRNPSSSSSPSLSPSPSPIQPEKINTARMLRSRLDGFEKGDRRKFSVALSRVEIEEDFLAIKGAKPARRPKKRAKYLQRQLDALFPGSWLSEVTPDLYKIEAIAS